MNRTNILLLTITCLLLSVGGFAQRNPTAQQRLITISMQRVSLETVFAEIEKQTPYRFIYKPALLANSHKVTLVVRNATIEEVLPLIFKDQPFEYELFKESVLLTPPPQGNASHTTEAPRISIKGRITNKTGDPIPSVTIIASRSKQQITTDEQGNFTLNNLLLPDSLIVSSVGYLTQYVKIKNNQALLIELEQVARQLSEVVVATGYQKKPIEEQTGSFSKVDNKLLNYKVSTNILERLEGVAPSVLFIKNPQGGTNPSTISIRGRSTIFAYPDPLVILDNFPYTGDVNNINPNDIESITILKDAAAASIWGAYAANGVIVITTKAGKYGQAIKLSFNANVTVTQKPDLYYAPTMSASDYIDVERFLFANEAFVDRETNPLHPALSPAAEIMIQERDGLISSAKATALLNTLRQQDVRKDQEKYLYRLGINQQYSLSASGGGAHNQYYFSAGYDRNLPSQVGNQYNRITLNANNTYALLQKKLELTTGIIFSATQVRSPNNDFAINYPYAQLKDANGQPTAL